MLAFDLLMADFDCVIEQRRTNRTKLTQVIERLEEHTQERLKRKREYVREQVTELSCK